MRCVLFSDTHGNVVALEAVLAEIRAQPAPDAIIVAGDLVANGPRPAETLALLRSIPGAKFVRGNTDQYVLDRSYDVEEADFVRTRLDQEALAFIDALPFEQRIDVAPGHELLVVHANPRDLEAKITPEHSDEEIRPLLAGVSAELIAFGHHHVPFIRQVDGYTLVDVASCGLPRDGDQRAVYVTAEWDGNEWHVAHHRVPFDIEAVARDYHTVDFPNANHVAHRLLKARYG